MYYTYLGGDMKKCNACGSEKNSDGFHKRKASIDGLSAKCRACQSEYDKARANNPDRVRAREEYAKTDAGKESIDKAKKKWAANNNGKIYEITKSYRDNNPNKYRAHGKVAYAVKCGDLTSKPCEACGIKKTQAHHDDYSKALDVRWLCHKHHKKWHKENGEGLNP